NRNGPANPGTSTANPSPASARTASGSVTSSPAEMHRGPSGLEGLDRHGSCPVDAGGQHVLRETRGPRELGSPLPERLEAIDQVVGEQGLAVDAPELAGPTRRVDPIDVVRGERPVQREDRADLRPAGVAPADLLRVGDERTDAGADVVGLGGEL